MVQTETRYTEIDPFLYATFWLLDVSFFQEFFFFFQISRNFLLAPCCSLCNPILACFQFHTQYKLKEIIDPRKEKKTSDNSSEFWNVCLIFWFLLLQLIFVIFRFLFQLTCALADVSKLLFRPNDYFPYEV